MSKGPGRIERAIVSILDAAPDRAFTTKELCKRVYGTGYVEKKHRVAVLRAARQIVARRNTTLRIHWGNEAAVFNCTSVTAYGLAYLQQGRADYLLELVKKHLDDNSDESLGSRWRARVASWTAEYEALRAGDVVRADEIVRERDAADEANSYRAAMMMRWACAR
jgi:hypothetical protein